MEVRWQLKEFNLSIYHVNPSTELIFSDLAAYTPIHWAFYPALFCAVLDFLSQYPAVCCLWVTQNLLHLEWIWWICDTLKMCTFA